MATVNIPRDVKDEFYRYKMPVLVAKVEGKGNGIKTVIVNMADIAKSLARPAAYPTKFFGFELGSITTIEAEKNKYIVNGKHDQSKLAEVLDDFIEKFVLCKKCQRNPETYMIIKGGCIELKCKACGGRTACDMRHKLCTFILKNPPPEEKEIKKVKKVTKRNEDDDDDKEENGKEEEKLPKSSSKSKKKKKEESDDDDDVVWYTDTSKEAAEERRKKMLDNTSELAAKLLNTGIADPVDDLKTFLESKPANTAIIDHVKAAKAEHKLGDKETVRLVFLGLFNSDVNKQVKTDKLQVVKTFVTNAEGQAGLLAGLTELAKDAAVLKAVPHVIKHLYDEDVLEEEPIMKWYNEKTKAETAVKVKEAAKMFVDWLENADEESSDEDEETDSDE